MIVWYASRILRPDCKCHNEIARAVLREVNPVKLRIDDITADVKEAVVQRV